MRIVSALALGLVLLAAPAAAQSQADPVMTHYRAYQAAYARNDLATAETEAEAAFAASEAVNGARTAVLALNLAMVRLEANKAAEAVAPAQRALTLAEAGAQGVDVTLVAVVLGRAELATTPQAGADRLDALLASDALARAPANEVYPAMFRLGLWALGQNQFERAERAMTQAAVTSSGSPFGERFGYAQARMWQAAALFYSEIHDNGRREPDEEAMREAYLMLSEALLIFRPMADIDVPSGDLTIQQLAYAQTLAVRGAIRAKMRAHGQEVPFESIEAQGDTDGVTELGSLDLTAPRCRLEVAGSLRQYSRFYPAEELINGQLGSVVLHLRLDATGRVTSHASVARVGSDGFVAAAGNIGQRLRFVKSEDSPPNCRMPISVLQNVVFLQ